MVKKNVRDEKHKIHSKNLNKKDMWEILQILMKYVSGCGVNLSH